MRINKDPLLKNGGEPSAFTPGDYLRAIFAATREDGTLVIPGEDYCDDFRTERDAVPDVTVRMKWTKKDLEDLIGKARELTDLIGMIARLGEPLTEVLEIAPEVLQPGLVDCRNTYLAGFDPGYKKEGDPEDPEAEEDLIARHRAANAADAARRVGEGPYAYAVVMRASRLYRLHLLNAPEAVVNAEAALFAQALALHDFAC